MKFGDKLVALRKKNGLSQEDLAAKLNVSRQSVSKWESNNTYPETDKIIQICTIFDCTMDDLINDNVTDLSSITRKSKNNFNIVIDSLLEFITKTINMFSDMKFISGFKCLIEMFIIGFILAIIGMIITGLITDIIYNLFSFLPLQAMDIVTSITTGLSKTAWLIVSLIVLVHIFKIRYLDYYNSLVDKEKNSKGEVPEKEAIIKKEKFKIKKEPQIIIRDPNHEPFAFLSVLSKIIICFVKFVVGCIGLCFVISLIAFTICLVICIPFSKYTLIFIGADISLIGTIIINILILLLIINFIFNRKNNIKIMIITAIISIITIGLGIGISFISLKDIQIKDSPAINKYLTLHEEKLNYEDNMLITTDYAYDYEYIIDNSIATDTIIIDAKFNDKLNKMNIHKLHTYEMADYNFYFTTRINFKEMYKIITNDLKNNTFRDYSYLYDKNIKIIASKTTIDKLINNLSKVYIFNKDEIDNGYKISNIEDKINSIEDECGAIYDARTNTLTSPSSQCICKKESIQTEKGTAIEYSCTYNEDSE